MAGEGMRTGTTVQSLRGRDRGRLFFVLGREGDRILVADGDLHPVRRPKKKNPKHVRSVSLTTERLTAWAQAGRVPEDHELRRELESLRAQLTEGGAEDVQGRHH